MENLDFHKEIAELFHRLKEKFEENKGSTEEREIPKLDPKVTYQKCMKRQKVKVSDPSEKHPYVSFSERFLTVQIADITEMEGEGEGSWQLLFKSQINWRVMKQVIKALFALFCMTIVGLIYAKWYHYKGLMYGNGHSFAF